MCCKNFWKRIIPFFLTFCLGILFTNLLIFNNTSNENNISQLEQNLSSDSKKKINLEKKCIPVKTNLKEQKEFYTLKELSIINMIDKRVELESQLKDKNLTEKDQKKIQRNIENIKKKVDEYFNRKVTLDELSNNRPLIKPVYLIYLEKCFEK